MYDREFSVLGDSVWIELGGGVRIVDCVDGNWVVIHWEGRGGGGWVIREMGAGEEDDRTVEEGGFDLVEPKDLEGS